MVLLFDTVFSSKGSTHAGIYVLKGESTVEYFHVPIQTSSKAF